MLNDLLRDLLLAGVELSIEDGKPRVRAAEGALSPETLESLRRNRDDIVRVLPDLRVEAPLSAGQEGLWAVQKGAPDSHAYNVGVALHIASESDHVPLLRQAVQRLVNRHPLLRATYPARDGRPVMLIEGFRAIELPEIDASHMTLEEVASASLLFHERPFDLESEGGLRACLFRRGPCESVLVLGVHHVATDGWSFRRLVDELLRLFEAGGGSNPLPPVKRSYHDFVRVQQETLAARGEELRREWKAELEGAPLVLDLPTDRPRSPVQSLRGDTLLREIDPPLVAGLRALAASKETTLYTVLLAAYQILLHRYTGQDDLCVGTAAALRDREEIADVLGYMVNLVVLRTRLDAGEPPAFADFLDRTRATVLRALERQDYPFPRLVEDVLDRRDPSRPPVVQALFSYQRAQLLGDAVMRLFAGQTVTVAGARVRTVPVPFRMSEVDLTLEVTEHGGSVELGFRYNTDLFETATIERMAGCLTTLLRGIVDDPRCPVSRLPLLTPAERERLLVDYNRTETPWSSQACIHELFEAQVDRAPDAVAVVDLCGQPAGSRGVPITYRDLDRRANRVAHRLRRLGVGPEVLVGLCLPRGIDLIVGLLGVLKAGGAFVPLDLEHPKKRLSFLLEDTAVSVVLTQGSSLSKLPETSAQIVDFEQGFRGEREDRPASGVRPENLVYIMYTSGSTGEPNGSLIEHRSLCNVVEVTLPLMEIGPGSRLAHATAFNFDGAAGPLFWMLVAGGTVYLAPRDPDYLGAPLVEMMEREAITQIFTVPAMLAAMPESKLPAMRAMAIGGERVSAELVDRWGGGTDRFVCIYGPTEATVFSTATRCRADGRDPAIGRPLGNYQAYILDRWLQPVPTGVIGELYLGGAGVARGYHRRPELTACKFLQNPFGPGRIYRTGDMVRYRPSSGDPPLIDFVGRVDGQIKLRGQRIELGEIQAALRACEGVRDAVAVVIGAVASARIVAYVVPSSPDPSRESELLAELKACLDEALPSHMMPSAIVSLPALPVNINGKIDIRALPPPPAAGAAEIVEARNETERALVEAWRQVLKVERLGVHDNFFELGGDSILSIQIVARAQALGVSIRTSQIFEQQTIAKLAQVAGAGPARADGEVVQGPVPLTPIQRWFLEQGRDRPDHFNQAVLLETPPGLDPALLRRALSHLQEHHDALRIRYVHDGSGWAQACLAQVDGASVEEVDLSGLAPAERPSAIERVAARLHASLDLAAGPLMRVALFHFGAGEPGRLLWIIHHLVVDAVSWLLLLPDLGAAYQALAAGKGVHLPAKTTSFKRWAERLVEHAASASFDEERTALAFDPPAPLPVDGPGGDDSSEAEIRVELSEEQTRHLLGNALAPYNLRVQEVLLTALAQAAARWTGSGDVWLDLEGHGREDLFDDVDLSRTVGWFTAMFPVRLHAPDEGPAESLIAVKEQLRRLPRRGIGYGLLRYLRPEGATLRWPRPDIAFNYLGRASYLGQARGEIDSPLALRFAPEPIRGFSAAPGPRAHALEVNALVSGDRLLFSFGYSPALHTASTVRRLADEVVATAGQLIEHCLSPDAGELTPADFPLVEIRRAELRELVARLGRAGAARIEAIYPLTPLQEGMLVHTRKDEAWGMYSIHMAFRIDGRLDAGALRAAWERAVRRHPLLGSCFFFERVSEPVQVVLRDVELPWEEHDVRGDADPEARLGRLDAELEARRIPLDVAPPLRLTLVRTGDERHDLFLDSHHLLLDGWSLGVVLRSVMDAYHATVQGRPPPAIDAGDYSGYMQWLCRQEQARSDAFWRRVLAGFETPTPLAGRRIRHASEHGHPVHEIHLGEELTSALKAAAEAHRITMSTMLQGAWAILLARYTGQSDVLFGAVVSGREVDVPGLGSTVGLFINTLPVRARLDGEQDLWTWLHALQTEQVEAREHQHVPLVDIQRLTEVPAGTPLFETLVAFENYPMDWSLFDGSGIRVRNRRWSNPTHYALAVGAFPAADMPVTFDYDPTLFDAATIERIARHVEQILREMVSAGARRLDEVSLLDEEERKKLVVTWNRTEAPFSSDTTIHQLFEAHADRAPDAVAIVDLCAPGSQPVHVTYAELDRRANRVAHHLRRLGVTTETRVGVFLPRGADLVAALLGVLKAGGTVAVLDPEHPQKRLAFLLEDTGVEVVLAGGASRAALPATRARVADLDQALASEPEHRPAPAAGPTNVAYVLYTSGSTGEPNGALIEHRGLINSTEAHIQIMETGPGTRLLHVLSFNFDAAMAHLFNAICAGGALYLAPRTGDFLGAGLVEAMEREAITHAMLVPSMLAALPDAELPALRTLVVGGERCTAELVERWGRTHRMLNMYGPTEASILATSHPCVPDGTEPPIGRPIPNIQVYVVDPRGRLAPTGVAGELWLGGVGVGRGYLNRPELTARKFVDNPFVEGGGRLYRTGDLVRYREVVGGPPVLEFIGRIDTQVKIRGHRVELSEVEAALRALPQVRDAVVTTRPGPDGGGARLVGYVTSGSRARSRELELEQVASWDALSHAIDAKDQSDLSLDLRGWKSSYTGEDIPPEHMRVWAESTVERILDLGPEDVLEIGCGTGMLLTRVAPRVRSYRGTDLARHAIEHVTALKARLPGLDNVEVSQQPAHDLQGLGGKRFDTVILNSVVQYFPSAEYLFGVLEGVLGLMKPQGSLFLGDVRNLALLETYHASVERFRAGGAALTRRDLRQRVDRAMVRENELVLDPLFFTAITAAFPQIVGVDITPKRGAFRDELTMFRYDVTLRLGGAEAAPSAVDWRDGAATTPGDVRAWVARGNRGRALGLRGVPNARLVEENALVRWMRGEPDDSANSRTGAAWDPEALFALQEELPCRVRVSWAAGREDGSLDVLVSAGDGPAPPLPPERPRLPERWSDLANDPLQGRIHRELAASVRRELLDVLPPHLVPSAIVVLPALPLTLNGKIDTAALPPPDASRDTASGSVEPRTPTERALAEVWCQVLGLAQVGVHDNFFDLGGDSILGIQIVSKAQALGISIRTSQIFKHQTIAELAEAAGTLAREIDQGAESGPAPLTPIQRWFFSQDPPVPGHFNQAVFLEVPIELDHGLLRRALQHLQAHHDALRMRYVHTGADWRQECAASLDEIALENVDLAGLPPAEARAAMAQAAMRLQGSLDLSEGPLMRVALFRLGSGEPGRLLWVIHHLVVDAVSWQILLPDLELAYRQLAAGQAVTLPPKTTSFKRWAERLGELAGAEAFDEERAIMALPPPVPLPVDHPGGRNSKESMALLRVELPAQATLALVGDALRPHGLTVQEVLLAALADTVARWTGSTDVWVDLEGHGREDLFEDVDLTRTVGWFTTLFPVCLRLPGEDAAELLTAVKEQVRAVPRRGIGYGMLRYLRRDGESLRWPGPEIAFNYLGRSSFVGRTGGAVESPLGLRFAQEDPGPLDTREGRRSHVLQINALLDGDQLAVYLLYSTSLHEAATVERLAADFLDALGRLIRHCSSPGAGSWSPADFPLVALSREELHLVAGRVGEQGRSRIEAIYPLTSLQADMLRWTLESGAADMYMTQAVIHLEGELDTAALRAAWQGVLRAHPLLRSCFVWEGVRRPVQVVVREAELPLSEIDLRDAPDRDARLHAVGEHLAARGIPLDAAPVGRLTLVRTADRRHALFYDCHHVLTDGWSLGVILREVFEAYRAAKQGSEPRLTQAGSYEAYLRWMERQPKEAARAFWRRTMDGFHAPETLSFERRSPAGPGDHRFRELRLDADLTARMKAAAEAHRVTPRTLFDGAWALLLARTSGRSDVVFGSLVSGREAPVPGIEGMAGLFIRALPVRTRVDSAEDVWTWLRVLQAEEIEARDHQHLSLAEIQGFSATPPGKDLFRSVVIFENYPLDRSASEGTGLTVDVGRGRNPMHYPMVVYALPGREMLVYLDHDAARIAPAVADRLARQLERILRAVISAPSPRLGDLLRASAAEERDGRAALPGPHGA